jgi:hypothetical protein
MIDTIEEYCFSRLHKYTSLSKGCEEDLKNIILDTDSDAKKLEVLLNLEYVPKGYKTTITGAVIIQTVPIHKVKPNNINYFQSIGSYTENRPLAPDDIIAVCQKDGDYYKVRDGYHRFFNAIKQNFKYIDIIVVEDLTVTRV